MDFLIGIAAQTALLHSSFDGYGDSHRGYVAVEHDGIYAKVGYENGKSRIDGQPWFKSEAFTVGAGYRLELMQNFSLRLEGGYWKPTTTELDKAVEEEIAFTYLVGRHSVGGLKPIPLQQVTLPDGTKDYAPCATWGGEFYPDQCYSSEAWLGEGWYAEIGATAEVYSGIEIDLSYRYLRPDSYLAVYDPERWANNQGWWEERGLLNYDTINFSIQWRF